MKKTEKLGLNQWERTDPILMSAFNENFSKLEDTATGAAKIAAGVYTGNGKSGKSAPNTLTFEFEPKFLLILNQYGQIYEAVAVLRTMDKATVYTSFTSLSYGKVINLTWSNKTVSWYSSDATYQLNTKDYKYHFLAIG